MKKGASDSVDEIPSLSPCHMGQKLQLSIVVGIDSSVDYCLSFLDCKSLISGSY